MTGLELTAKIYAKEIENGTKIKAIKENGDIVNLIFESDMLKWESGTFNTGYLFDSNVKFEIVEKEKAKGWFKPEEDDQYYFIDAYNEINCCYWNNDVIDDNRYNNHNCFRSEEEAEDYLCYKKALKEAEKPFIYEKNNWHMVYNLHNKKIYVDWNSLTKKQGVIYLGQEEKIVQKFIEKWHDQILRYEFDVWED